MTAWPSYSTLPHDHVHAIGVIALNYNSYEESLFALFNVHLEGRGLPEKLNEYLYSGLNRPDQMGSLEKIFAEFEKEEAVKTCVAHVMKHFQWSFEARNIVMHAMMDFIQNRLDSITLRKRSSKDFSKHNLIQLSLPQLRTIADEMRKGHEFLKSVYVYIAMRDKRLSGFTRGLIGLGEPPTLPQIFPVPKPIEVQDHPLNRISARVRPRSSPA
jgi:hypothetical protein